MKSLQKAMTAGLLALAGLMPAGAQQSLSDNQDPTEPCFIPGIRERVRCMTLEVPLDYDNPDGRKIDVFTAIVPARGSNAEKDALWLLAGGPGQAAAEWGGLAKTALRAIHQKRDIVLMDQRGTGKSNPLECKMGSEQVFEELTDWTRFIADCRAEYDIDVRHFTMENVIRDMEEVRKALGQEKLNLWGGSWGTRTAGLYEKRHPDRVRSIVIDGVAPPDVSLFESAPASAERALRLLAQDCLEVDGCAVKYPDFEENVDTLIRRAENGDLRYEGKDLLTGKPLSFDLNFTSAVEGIRALMYSANSTVMLPYLVQEAVEGNLAPWAAAAASGGDAGMYLGATLSILCGEELPRVRADALEAAATDSFAKDSYYQYWKAGCQGWESMPGADDAHEPIATDVPTLILSGNLDPITPPEMGEHWLKGASNARHIVVNGNGHITSNTACMPRLIGEFVDTLDPKALDDACLGHMKRLPVVTGINGTVN
ncbi:MAG: alpha/beta fold hydrolase [Alphaproteobacteria bacterium]|nr:alpha/beta fold hydrolase [Alphaproteobacteria bacterium]